MTRANPTLDQGLTEATVISGNMQRADWGVTGFTPGIEGRGASIQREN